MGMGVQIPRCHTVPVRFRPRSQYNLLNNSKNSGRAPTLLFAARLFSYGLHPAMSQLRTRRRSSSHAPVRLRRVIFIIDEAQGLHKDAVEEFRLLSNLVSDGRPLLQVSLGGHERRKPQGLSVFCSRWRSDVSGRLSRHIGRATGVA